MKSKMFIHVEMFNYPNCPDGLSDRINEIIKNLKKNNSNCEIIDVQVTERFEHNKAVGYLVVIKWATGPEVKGRLRK